MHWLGYRNHTPSQSGLRPPASIQCKRPLIPRNRHRRRLQHVQTEWQVNAPVFFDHLLHGDDLDAGIVPVQPFMMVNANGQRLVPTPATGRERPAVPPDYPLATRLNAISGRPNTLAVGSLNGQGSKGRCRMTAVLRRRTLHSFSHAPRPAPRTNAVPTGRGCIR